MTNSNSTSGGTGAGSSAGGFGSGGKSNVDLGDNKLKGDPEQSGDDTQLPNVPKDAVGNYDPDHAAPGDYSVPPSFGPTVTPSADDSSEAAKEPKDEDKADGDKDDVKKASANSADKEKLEDKPKEPIHGDTGTPGLTPGQKAASVKDEPAIKTIK